jgi:large subunit ribosomal protein L29
MKLSELKELSAEELTQKLTGFKKSLFDLRMLKAGGKLSKPHEMGLIRRDIARVLTLLRQLEEKSPEGAK